MTPEKEERCASDVNLYWSPIDFSKQTQGKLSRGMVNTKQGYQKLFIREKKINLIFMLSLDWNWLLKREILILFYDSL